VPERQGDPGSEPLNPWLGLCKGWYVKGNMEESFKEILSIEDMKGIMLFSGEGKLLFKKFLDPPAEEPEKRDWWALFIASLNGIREADLVFERGRLYIRRTDLGYLLILMGVLAPVAMVRLHCDMVLPSLKRNENRKGLGRLFKKKS
jgi:hypothetical protein